VTLGELFPEDTVNARFANVAISGMTADSRKAV